MAADLNATLLTHIPGVLHTPVQQANGNTDLLADLTYSQNLCSAGICFKKLIHSLATFIGPKCRERRVAALDHLLVRKAQASWILDASTKGFAIPTVTSDHRPLCGRVQIRLQTAQPRAIPTPPKRRWDVQLSSPTKTQKLDVAFRDTLASTVEGCTYSEVYQAVDQISKDLTLVKRGRRPAQWEDSQIQMIRRTLGAEWKQAHLTGRPEDRARANMRTLELARAYAQS